MNETVAHQFRVTKYDPAYRNQKGLYLRDEWASIGDIGKTFDGETLTQSDYDAMENAYVDAAVGFMEAAGIGELQVCGLENTGGDETAPDDGTTLDLIRLREPLRSVLRERYWCRFESQNAFIHVGYDYYMYIGVPDPCRSAQASAQGMGLFVEPFPSPYQRSS